ncbi:MAG: ATP-binding protein, partial [bacterium]|nr:ATP-binding protein [bacterium]
MPPKRKIPNDSLRGTVRPHDPFELIRWLAYSQPDPRKALAELVQNSLDAGAGNVRITRLRVKGTPCLRIWDDGNGVIPEFDRTAALRFIATNIGHSRKRNLSVQERHALMTQGQYGIGLLGFWSLGERLEMRTSVPGQQPMRLVLHRDDSRFEIEPLRGRLLLDERWTEILVLGIHPGAQSILPGRRAADYLAAELRGQLLSRDVNLVYEDHMSRGRAQKVITIRPRRFLGEKLAGFDSLEVPGHAPIRLELHLRSPATAAGTAADDGAGDDSLAVYAAGTAVARGFAELASLGLDHAPWTDTRLSGMVDFPDFTVAPGSRRGVVNDAAAEAFAVALASLEPALVATLAEIDRRRAEELDRTLIRDLQRAFRDLLRSRTRYVLPQVASRSAER